MVAYYECSAIKPMEFVLLLRAAGNSATPAEAVNNCVCRALASLYWVIGLTSTAIKAPYQYLRGKMSL